MKNYDVLFPAIKHLKCDGIIDNVTVSFPTNDPESPGGIRRIKYGSIKVGFLIEWT